MWQRNFLYPATYSRFEGKLEVNGRKRQYWIQDLTEEYDSIVLSKAYDFTRGEPLCKYSKLYECPESVKVLADKWKVTLSQRTSLLCLTKNEKGETEIAGFNITGPVIKGQGNNINGGVKPEKAAMMDRIREYVANIKDVFSVFECGSFLCSKGMLVFPQYRGDGLCVEMLKSREGMCKNLNLGGSATMFTSIFTQNVARKIGYKELSRVSYETLQKEDPTLYFPGISEFTKDLIYMYINY